MATAEVSTYNKYLGNGVTTEFSIGFPYLKREYVKVYVKRKDSEQESVSSSDFSFVNDSTIKFPANGSIQSILSNGDVLTVQRETPLQSDFIFSNQKRLFPDDVMDADDLSFQQIQELARDIKRSVKVTPTGDQTPDELLAEVYSKLDSATEVAEDAIAAASQAQTAADNATAAVESAEKTLIETQAYVNAAKVEIDNTKETALEEVDNKVTGAKADVNTTVVTAQADITSTKDIAINTINNAIVDGTGEISRIARDVSYPAAERAEAAANIATNKAAAAANSANIASSKEANTIQYANAAENSARSAKNDADLIAHLYKKKKVFIIGTPSGSYTGSRTEINTGEDLSNQSVDLFWNGQMVVQNSTNWSISDNTVILNFNPPIGSVVTLWLNDISRIVEVGDLTVHNNDGNAHPALISQIDSKCIIRQWS